MTGVQTCALPICRLTLGFWTPPNHYSFSNWVSTPDAKWGVFAPNPVSGRQQWEAMKIPPTPTSDGVIRTGFVQTPVAVAGNGTGTARVKFWYGENAPNGGCTTRQEACYTSTAATPTTNPFDYASEPPHATGSCTAGCTINVPLIPGRCAMVQPVYTTGSPSTGQVSVICDTFSPGGSGVAAQLAFTSTPSSGTAGSALSSVSVTVEDSGGNPVTSSTAAITISSSPAGVGGTLTVNAVSGVATFSGLTINTAGSYTLSATSSGLTGATSTSIIIAAASASQVVFTTAPSSGTTGHALTPAVVATIEDAFNNVVTASTAAVVVSSTPAGVAGTLTVNAASGVATFSNLAFSVATNYTLTASSSGLTGATSSSFTITSSVGPASQLVFTSVPLTGVVGSPLSSVTVQIEDASGNPVTSSTASVTISSAPSGVSGTLTASAVSGVATFSALSFASAGNYTLTATSSGLTGTTSPTITISSSSGTASKLAFTSIPAGGYTGTPISTVNVTVEDSSGIPVSGSTATITISSSLADVSGTLTVNAVSGVARFSGLTFSSAGSHTLTVTSSGLTGATSVAIHIYSSSNKLAFTVQPPATGTAAQALSPSIVVQVQDVSGNLVTSSTASITISSTPSGVGGTLTVNASGGIATFSALNFTTAGSYTLTATSAGLTGATSTSILIGPGASAQLVIAVQPPSTGTVAQPLVPAVVVQIQDANGNIETGSTAAVSIGSTAAGVGGTLTVNASSGVATFSNLAFTATGSYTLTATSTGLSNATSTSVAIATGPAAMLAFTVGPSNGTAGTSLTSVSVTVEDASGNPVTGSTAAITISSSPTGVLGTVTANAVAGIATFSALDFTAAGTYALKATSPGLATATSGSISIGPGTPTQLTFSVNVAGAPSATVGHPINPAPVVQIEDTWGNLCTGSTASVTISSSPAGVGGTLTASAVAGVASFGNLVFSASGTFVLTAASSGLASASSNSFSVALGPASAITGGKAVDGGQFVQHFLF